MESVWIVYIVLTFDGGRKVAGILKTEEEALIFADNLSKKLSGQYGIDIQQWEIDTIN